MRRAAKYALRLAVAAGATLAGTPSASHAQIPVDPAGPRPFTDSVYVRDVGPGRPGRLLRTALRGPRVVYRPQARVIVKRTDTVATNTILIGPELAIDGVIRGDLIVVGGDAFVHPGAVVEGRAIGIGGCIYVGETGRVQGGIECFDEETFVASRDANGHLALDYRALIDRSVALFQLPLGIGLRIPTYDRVNGASVAWGPIVSLDTGRITIEPLVTYRSHLGEIDPGVVAKLEVGRRADVTVWAQRGTFTNERWIRDSLSNSLLTLLGGIDARNYYRADRIEAVGRRKWETTTTTWQPWVGARTERAWSAGLDSTTRFTGRRAWAAYNRDDEVNGMRRANPRVLHDRLTSVLGGTRLDFEGQGGLVVGGDVSLEGAVGAPSGRGFVQGIVDATVGFPTIREHTLELQFHAMLTASDSTPAQRYSYLGGSGTIPTRNLLAMGGDQLLHLESRYNIPFTRPTLPFLGAPTLTLRHVIGAAGVGELPEFAQNVGVRIGLGFVRFDYMVDPARGESRGGVGVAFGR